MTRQEIEQRTFDLLDGGYHCAESVLLAVMEACGGVPAGMPRVATCFGGGVGKTHEELCGALAGGLMALGFRRGRDSRGQDWGDAARLAARLRQEFITRFGASACKDVLAALGEQENMIGCKRLSGCAAGLAFDLLQESGEAETADARGCSRASGGSEE